MVSPVCPEIHRLNYSPLTGTTVTLLTFDTSQAARARNAGLAVNKLSKPLGEEPGDTTKKKV